MKVRSIAGLLLAMILLPSAAAAQKAREFDDYVVHYSAFTADTLNPEVARNYDIRRSPGRAVLNIVVMRKEGDKTVPVRADIQASAVNLNQQSKRFRLREEQEGEAIYYLADFAVSHKEVLDFTLSVTPEGTSRELDVEFRQQFFTEEPPE